MDVGCHARRRFGAVDARHFHSHGRSGPIYTSSVVQVKPGFLLVRPVRAAVERNDKPIHTTFSWGRRGKGAASAFSPSTLHCEAVL